MPQDVRLDPVDADAGEDTAGVPRSSMRPTGKASRRESLQPVPLIADRLVYTQRRATAQVSAISMLCVQVSNIRRAAGTSAHRQLTEHAASTASLSCAVPSARTPVLTMTRSPISRRPRCTSFVALTPSTPTSAVPCK